MRIHFGALCVTTFLLMATKAGAECEVPMAPTFGTPGTAVTYAQKRAAYDVLTQYTQQVMLFNTCAKQERTALAAQTQSPETKAAMQSNTDRRKLAAEQYILAGTRYQQYAMPTAATTAMPEITANSDPASLIASLQGLNQGALPGQGLQPHQLQQLQLAQQMLQLQQGAGQTSQQTPQQVSQQIAKITPHTTRQAQQLQELQQMQQQLQQLQQIQPQDRNSRRNGSQPSANPVPVASASALSAAPSATGDTFKSVCWNHNLNAAEMLDCGACEKQYADMLPQLNQLAANKKQSQLNAFLGDCPKNPQQSQQMPAPANQRLNQSLLQPTSQPQPQNLSLPMQHVEVVDKHDVVKREMQIGLRAEQVKRKIAERYTQSSQMQQLRETLVAFNKPLDDSRQQFIQEGAQADERYILQAKKETDPRRIPPLEELRQAERTAAWARKCDRDEQYLSDVETGKVR